jgi:hypothetical protein
MKRKRREVYIVPSTCTCMYSLTLSLIITSA